MIHLDVSTPALAAILLAALLQLTQPNSVYTAGVQAAVKTRQSNQQHGLTNVKVAFQVPGRHPGIHRTVVHTPL